MNDAILIGLGIFAGLIVGLLTEGELTPGLVLGVTIGVPLGYFTIKSVIDNLQNRRRQ